jgi:hypothetical protein
VFQILPKCLTLSIFLITLEVVSLLAHFTERKLRLAAVDFRDLLLLNSSNPRPRRNIKSLGRIWDKTWLPVPALLTY